MKLLSGILGAIIAILVVIIVIYFGIRKIIGKNQMKILTSMAKNASKNKTNDKTLSREEIDNTMNTLIAEFAKNNMNLEFNR